MTACATAESAVVAVVLFVAVAGRPPAIWLLKPPAAGSCGGNCDDCGVNCGYEVVAWQLPTAEFAVVAVVLVAAVAGRPTATWLSEPPAVAIHYNKGDCFRFTAPRKCALPRSGWMHYHKG
ncbi:7612_t:CDS:2 [Ambispora gerdemannii]|uniref:7612_t:CDS:1 n=1 Tax=Ambispora gerdemannii TaxID=144530 RepID=A0A9N9CKY9_9GLOM|nr:7612_t:CDS:2 [Ambispora gerdemannii]